MPVLPLIPVAVSTNCSAVISLKWLKPQGNLLVKMFQGAAYQDVLAGMRNCFERVATRKPEASRGRSSEVYLLGKGLRPGVTRPSGG